MNRQVIRKIKTILCGTKFFRVLIFETFRGFTRFAKNKIVSAKKILQRFTPVSQLHTSITFIYYLSASQELSFSTDQCGSLEKVENLHAHVNPVYKM